MKKTYMDKVHIWGRIWVFAAIVVLMSVPLAISIHYDAWPEAKTVLKALLSVALIYWTSAIIEVITYTPMLGAGGTYLSFITGNITNLKLPCSLNAMENAKVRANSEEGEVISTIAIGVSSIVTTVVIAIGVLCFTPILPKITAEGSVFKAASRTVRRACRFVFQKALEDFHFPDSCGLPCSCFCPRTRRWHAYFHYHHRKRRRRFCNGKA